MDFFPLSLYANFSCSDAETMTSALLLRGVTEEDRFMSQVLPVIIQTRFDAITSGCFKFR